MSINRMMISTCRLTSMTCEKLSKFEMLLWLVNHATKEDIIPGATFVGDGRGYLNSDWDIYRSNELDAFVIQQLQAN